LRDHLIGATPEPPLALMAMRFFVGVKSGWKPEPKNVVGRGHGLTHCLRVLASDCLQTIRAIAQPDITRDTEIDGLKRANAPVSTCRNARRIDNAMADLGRLHGKCALVAFAGGGH
jgi:hypothetical protein